MLCDPKTTFGCILIIGAVMLPPHAAFADTSDDTVRYYLANCQIAVLGEIATEPIGLVSEGGVVDLVFDLKVHEVLAGDVAGHHLSVKVRRFESVAGDELSWLGKGAKVILFLKEAQPWEGRGWISVDMWFGVQPANRAMARSLKRLAAEGEANEAAMAEGVVLSFNDGIVEISLGSDDGIQAGQELYWRRGLRELGRLKVLSATAERAAAEVDRRFDRKLRNPHRNDRVLTRLIPPKPAPTTRQKN